MVRISTRELPQIRPVRSTDKMLRKSQAFVTMTRVQGLPGLAFIALLDWEGRNLILIYFFRAPLMVALALIELGGMIPEEAILLIRK